jgi:hypothetical protein
MESIKYWVYMRQADRRLYPCIVISDEKGMASVRTAFPNSRCSVVSAEEAEILKTFHGADRLHLKPAKAGAPPWGKWGLDSHPRLSHDMVRDEPVSVSNRWLEIKIQIEKELQQQQVKEKPPVYHPHTMSGFK